MTLLARARPHRPTVLGRMRSDPGPLLLIGLVVALTTALTSAVTPLTLSISDHALADLARHAGSRGLLVATFPGDDEDVEVRTRDPKAAAQFRAEAVGAQRQLPKRVAAVVHRGIASITTTQLHVVGGGPGRYLSLAYLDRDDGPPRVRYTSGGPPRATVGAARSRTQVPPGAASWPVQVAVSQEAAAALGLEPGDRLEAEDEQARSVSVRVSGVFVAREPSDDAWETAAGLLHPAQGVTGGVERVSAVALVSAAALPDLRLAVPADDLTERVTLHPRPDRLRWKASAGLVRAIVSLKAGPGVARGELSWDSSLDKVLTDGRAQVAAARGQADVLLLGLLACALLVLWQAAELLVRRRAASVVLTRERGGSLVGIASELVLETATFAAAGAALGLLVTSLAVGPPGWGPWLPVPFVAALAAGVTGSVLAWRATDPRRTPANRSARRTVARARRLRRWLFLGTVVALAALSFVALRERGVVAGTGDLTAASAPTWWSVAGALLVIGALPALAGLLLATTRRSTGGVAFFAAARVRETGTRGLPLLVVMVTVAQLTFAIALASTEQRGQAEGALLSVGGDTRISVPQDRSATDLARTVSSAPGVRAAVAGRVEDGVRAASQERAESVRLVAVDASAYEHLLAVSALPDVPGLERLERSRGHGVPALLVGGPAGLRDGLTLRGPEDRSVPLDVVGVAPRVQGSVDPVVVVDVESYARSGGVADPNTVWVVGPGSVAAARAHAGTGTVTSYAEELAVRRATPLAAGLVRLALASAALLMFFAVLAVAMSAAGEAVPRGESLGRLRALGLRDRELWGVLAGELVAPVVVGALSGLALGLSAAWSMFGRLSLERITAQVGPPAVSVPPWVLLSGAALLVTALVLARLEWSRLRKVVLGQLLRR